MNAIPIIQSSEQADPWMVERLVRAGMSGMSEASVEDVTTPSDILSASLTILSRTLYAVRKLELPEDRDVNTQEIHRVLGEFITDFGTLPS